MPKPVANLIHDLRERRMLPLVVLLIAAIVAIPFLLGEDAAEVPVPAGGVSSSDVSEIDGAEIADPVVLAEVPGIRNFKKRLADFQEQNPFQQQFTGVPNSVSGAEDAAEDAADEAGFPEAKAAADAAEAAAEGATGGTDDGSGAGGTGDSGGTGDTGTRKFAIEWKIDVKAGPVGDAKSKDGLPQLSFVPNKEHPVLQFIQGASKTSAIFVVSRSVGDTYGDGECAPQKNDCQFLLLEIGQARTFEYEPDGRKYKVKLTGVERIKREVTEEPLSGFAGLGD
jgi:hypothetical protein